MAVEEPSAIPVNIGAATLSSTSNRVSARVAATAVDSHGPGCSPAPSSSSTMPASTIVMPAPSYSGRHEQSGGAQVGEPAPHRLGGAGRIVEQRADMSGDGSFFGEKASHGVAQRDLLVGQLEVHERGNPRTRWAVMFLLIWVVPPAMVSERDVRR